MSLYIYNPILEIKNKLSQSAHEKFTKIVNMLFDKENIIQLHKVKMLQTTHTDQNAIKLEVKNTIKNVKSLPTWKMFILLNNSQKKQKKIEITKLLNIKNENATCQRVWWIYPRQ